MTAEAFAYKARSVQGSVKRGTITAGSVDEVFRRLQAEGLHPFSIRPARLTPFAGFFRPKPKLVELLEDLASLVEGGVNLGAALDLVTDIHAGSPLGDLADALRRQIQSGTSFDDAFGAITDRDAIMIAGIISTGQASGQLGPALQRAAALIRAREKAQEDLLTSSAYPLFLAAFSLLLLIFLVVGVVPSFEPILEMSDAEAPLPVAGLIAFSHALRAFGPWLILVLVVALISIRLVGGRGTYRRFWGRLWLDGPFASLGRSVVFGSSSVFLGMMLAGGVAAPDAVRMAAAACANDVARERLDSAARRLREGEGLGTALSQVLGYPRALVRMADIGGEIGVMGLMLARGGEVEQARAVRRITALTRAAGPALVLAVGALIGGIMASVFFTIASIGEVAIQ